MVMAFTGFAPTLTAGTQDFIAQRTHIPPREVSALFWITVAVGVGCALVIAACGPVIARFYGEPRLTMIAFALALTSLPAAARGVRCRGRTRVWVA
jgi:hypothetical protein